MTNEELALDILANNKVLRTRIPPVRGEIRDALIELANKKDQQFKEYLGTHKQPVLASETDDTIVGYSIDVDEIINELFNKE